MRFCPTVEPVHDCRAVCRRGSGACPPRIIGCGDFSCDFAHRVALRIGASPLLAAATMEKKEPLIEEADGESSMGPSRAEADAAALELAQGTGPDGLTAAEAADRLATYGPNLLEEKKKNELLVFLS